MYDFHVKANFWNQENGWQKTAEANGVFTVLYKQALETLEKLRPK